MAQTRVIYNVKENRAEIKKTFDRNPFDTSCSTRPRRLSSKRPVHRQVPGDMPEVAVFMGYLANNRQDR